MFRHPQLASLEKRKWDLVAESSSLRDDLVVEAFYWEKVCKWVDAGASVLKLIGLHRHWFVALLGAGAAWIFKTRSLKDASAQIKEAAEEGRGIVNQVLGVGQKALFAWKFFQHAKGMFQNYRAARHPQS